ncbi:hypothetical protein I7I51_04185 [Histoplasma capsulatum]|uniref:Uncharacterized protein n=1 Tax=Ajellomyces capsulatus TaxID=5037 RepID=A0A8A1M691_AJECA|nr:hypothetical protein I7I51_04185 [Histoplasma capsulatum]
MAEVCLADLVGFPQRGLPGFQSCLSSKTRRKPQATSHLREWQIRQSQQM